MVSEGSYGVGNGFSWARKKYIYAEGKGEKNFIKASHWESYVIRNIINEDWSY